MSIINRFPSGGGGALVEFNNVVLPSYPSILSLTSLSVPRYELASATDGGGNVIFAGGVTYISSPVASPPVASVDKYTTAGVRSTLTNLSQARRKLASATDGGGNAIFAGGNNRATMSTTVDKYTTAGVRSTLTNLSSLGGGYDLSGATDGGGNIIFAGGCKYYDGVGTFSITVDKYTTMGVKTSLENLSEGGYRTAASSCGDGSVLFVCDNTETTKYSISGIKSTLQRASMRMTTASMDGKGNAIFGGIIVEKYTKEGVRSILTSLQESAFTASTDGDGSVVFGCKKGFTARYLTTGVQQILVPLLTTIYASYASSADGNGNVIFAGGALEGGYPPAISIANKMLRVSAIPAPLGSIYKINSDIEKVLVGSIIETSSPVNGYIKYKKGIVS